MRVAGERREGSIPAGAGKPGDSIAQMVSHRVYPRGRGEAVKGIWETQDNSGLSPRARGSLALRRLGLVGPGSIPAGAGKPRPGRRSGPRLRVYPRGRGEAAYIKWKDEINAGLSPRARGSPRLAILTTLRAGSIPAGAGKPTHPSPSPHIYRVYPRGRGEAIGTPYRLQIDAGLSPRARGSRRTWTVGRSRSGSIPAGAGKPARRSSSRVTAWVYPRGRGEALVVDCPHCRDPGLSPRARGSPPREGARVPVPGSIPAGAGKPHTRTTSHSGIWVYPRGRGEATA